MANAVKKINEMSEEEFMKHLEKYQKMDKRMAEDETRRRRLQDQGKDYKEYLLCCKKCSQEACSSFDIKRYNKSQHYVCSQTFCSEKIEVRPHEKPKKIDELYKIGKVSCKKCGRDWGIIAKLADLYIPVIKIDSFVVYSLNADYSRGRPFVFKKWIQVPFSVEDVDFIDDDLAFDVDFELWT